MILIQKKNPFRIICVALILAFLTGRAQAHDFWLEAHPYNTEANKDTDISIHVGTDFIGDLIPNIPTWYTDFSLYTQDSRSEVSGELGRDPAGYVDMNKNGTYLVGYESIFTNIVIAQETFNKYLKEEGLLDAIRYREKHRETLKAGREEYMRHAKVLIQVGDSFEVDASSIMIGYELEIIPRQNPYKLSRNDFLEVQVLHNGKPQADIQIIAYSKVDPNNSQTIRTDSLGGATVTLNQSGPWIIKAVKIIRVDEEGVDWQSHWANLSFAIK